MAYIIDSLTDQNNNIVYPKTKAEAVYLENGKNIEETINNSPSFSTDAETLEGFHAADFQPYSDNYIMRSGNETATETSNVLLDANTLNGHSSNDFANTEHTHTISEITDMSTVTSRIDNLNNKLPNLTTRTIHSTYFTSDIVLEIDKNVKMILNDGTVSTQMDANTDYVVFNIPNDININSQIVKFIVLTTTGIMGRLVINNGNGSAVRIYPFETIPVGTTLRFTEFIR